MNIYKQRRENLLNSYDSNVCIIIYSGLEIMKSEDECFPFDVNRNFYYLTGLERDSMALVMYKVDGVITESIFALPYSEYASKWFGDRMPFEQITEISGVENVQEYDNLESAFTLRMNHLRKDANLKVALDLWRYTKDQEDCLGIKEAKRLKDLFPSLEIIDVFPNITKLRLVKDEYEVSCIKHALATTKLAHDQMMKNIKPQMNELMMQAIFDYSLRTRNCKHEAFDTICASGKRATVLHYRNNDQVMEDGELFLCDMGATYNHYCADISRTFPVNGKFTERQKEIYDLVLRAQQIVIENAKPGVKLKELNNMVIEFYKEELPKHGLTKDVSEYYYHGVSHHLGLDTHDSNGGLGQTLSAGNVITDEPGLYISDEGIGIRIEDDLLITEDGCVDLASDLLHTTEEIEAFMAK